MAANRTSESTVSPVGLCSHLLESLTHKEVPAAEGNLSQAHGQPSIILPTFVIDYTAVLVIKCLCLGHFTSVLATTFFVFFLQVSIYGFCGNVFHYAAEESPLQISLDDNWVCVVESAWLVIVGAT